MGDMPRPKPSPLRGRYLVTNRVWNLALTLVDGALGVLAPAPPSEAPGRPRRLLLVNGGHLGDVVITTAAIDVLRRRYPDVEIGMLVGSWARRVVEAHPAVARVHVVDHWKLNRGGAGHADRLARYRRTRRAALREIRDAGYDTAVDVYPFAPNAALLLWQARIPVRIGYDSGGFGPLLTHAVPWANLDRQVAEYHRALLDLLPRGSAAPEPELRSVLPAPREASARAVAERLRRLQAAPGSYVVIHMGSGSALKEWPLEKWRAVAERLVADGLPVILTGSGAEEARAAAAVADGLERCVSWCDELDWDAFVHTLRNARLLIGVDSAAGHVAAAFEVPTVAVFAGIANLSHWRPLNPRARVLTNPVPCAPCYRSQGCESMACVRGVGVDAVMDAARELLAAGEEAGFVPERRVV